jgi:hypothetical protein
MMVSVSDELRAILASMEGEIVPVFRPAPENKPPRRRAPYKNKTQRSDYHQDFQKDVYRGEHGKGYQKAPSKIKKFRAEQRKRLKEKFNLKGGSFHG